ncbi:MAG: hypothetical protein JWO40_473 [Candidatus Doudnabacteria bacterium]|nr:hypothetical protein [Candidatus Doudnabacteria bacterium]
MPKEPQWELDQKIIPNIFFDKNIVSIKNIRNFRYRAEFDYDVDYYDEVFDSDQIQQALIGFVHFSKNPFIAHALIKFEFKNNTHIVFSVEIRRKVNQKFSSWKTILPFYKIMYVLADQQDVITLRNNYRQNELVNQYKLDLNLNQLKALFLEMCKQAEEVNNNSKSFHLFFNSCASNLVQHLNNTSDFKIPWFYKYFAPGLLPQYLLKRKLIVAT